MTTKEWKLKNRDKVLEYGRKYRETHKERLKKEKRLYYEANKEKWEKYNAKRKGMLSMP